MASVAVIIVDADDHVLWAERPPGKPYAGWLELPGGKVEHGEQPEEAARREIREELGLELGDLTYWGTYGFPSYRQLEGTVEREWFVTTAFLASLASDTAGRQMPRPETKRTFWLPRNQVPLHATPQSCRIGNEMRVVYP